MCYSCQEIVLMLHVKNSAVYLETAIGPDRGLKSHNVLTFRPVLCFLVLLPLHALRLSLSSIHCSSLRGSDPCGDQGAGLQLIALVL